MAVYVLDGDVGGLSDEGIAEQGVVGTGSGIGHIGTMENEYSMVTDEYGMKHKVVLKTSRSDVGACVSMTVLVASLGLVKGDSQLGSRAHTEDERKGLLGEPAMGHKCD